MINLEHTTVKLREKQSKCSHPSFVCCLCGIYQDNLFNDYQVKIEAQEMVILYLEELLDQNHVVHNRYSDYLKSGIMDMWKHEKIDQYIRHTRITEEQEWLPEEGLAY